MSKRLYYKDPYRTRFSARVVERLIWDDHPAVVLDRTAFYPTSGGQPADRGTLSGLDVIDVIERAEDGAIVHVLSDALSVLSKAEGAGIEGVVDWPRRFDHMQQHTGQHILSAAFERLLEAETVGFHLGEESSTIDLDVTDLNAETVKPVEELANRVIWEDRAVNVRFIEPKVIARLPIERPPDVEGPVRIVEIAGPTTARAKTPTSDPDSDFDANPCGGTHVARTGEIGLIKIVDLNHRGDETRVKFLCGKRALCDYGEKNTIIHRLTGLLTVGHWELDQAVERLQDEINQLRRAQRQTRQQLLDMETAQLAESAVAHGPYRVIWRVWQGRSPDEIHTLARRLAEYPDVVTLLFGIDVQRPDSSGRTHFCFARAENLDLDVEEMVQEVCAELGGGGGGRPQAAQGSTPETDPGRIKGIVTSDLLPALI